MYFSLAVLDNEFRLLPSCLRCLWVCCLDGSHGGSLLPSLGCLKCLRIYLPVSAVKKDLHLLKLESCTRLRNPPYFHLYIKISKCYTFFWLDVPKDSHVVLWSKCLKTAEKSSQSVVAVFPHLINSARSYMTFLPHNVPQSIILFRLDDTRSFRKRLVSTNESSETNFRLFQVATKTGNEDEEKDRESWWRTPLFLRQFVVLLLRTFWPCSTFYRSYFCCLRHVFGKERLLAKNRYKI